MGKPILFASCKPLERAENINALYNTWDGDKVFVQMNPWRKNPEIRSGKYTLLVADETPAESPGKVVTVGHGYPGCKLGGLDQPHPYISKKDCSLLTYVITSSEQMIPITAKMFNVSKDKVLPLGKPRTDLYFSETKSKDFGDERIYLYAPTYRNKEETPLPNIDWDYLDRHLDDNEVFILKPHTMDGRQLHRTYKRIIEIPSSEPSNPYLLGCDVLITDYSSIMFDAHLLDKPVVLFEKTPGYLTTRGMYFKYPYEYASRFCTNEVDLLATIRSANEPQLLDRVARERVVSACDGHSTERILGLLEKLL